MRIRLGGISLVVGALIVGVAEWLGHSRLFTPIPFLVLAPGLFAGALAPDSGYNPEGDIHPWGIFSQLIAYGVNLGVYTVLAYLVLRLVQWLWRIPRRPV